ncbi:MAG: hypothetical protein IJ370_00650 [Oscillospiraceae bacterium]|nr:hypothetical protein [Oscillospiraceae bacterium]
MVKLTANNVTGAINTPLTEPYASNSQMMRSVIAAMPENKDIDIVCAKIAAVDYVYSTNLRLQRKKCTVLDVANAIIQTKDFDDRVKKGDASVVNEVLNKLDVNLFSFMSKYCFVHNCYVYKKDDYSIYDSAVKSLLPKYIKNYGTTVPKITGAELAKIVNDRDYVSFNNIVGQLISDVGINIANPRKAFDRFIWSQR